MMCDDRFSTACVIGCLCGQAQSCVGYYARLLRWFFPCTSQMLLRGNCRRRQCFMCNPKRLDFSVWAPRLPTFSLSRRHVARHIPCFLAPSHPCLRSCFVRSIKGVGFCFLLLTLYLDINQFTTFSFSKAFCPNITMYISMYKLLNLSPGSFTVASARRNYFKIMKVVHTDRNTCPEAGRVATAVVGAYEALIDPVVRAYYDRHGDLAYSVPYDNDEAEACAILMNQLLTQSAKPTEVPEEPCPSDIPEFAEGVETQRPTGPETSVPDDCPLEEGEIIDSDSEEDIPVPGGTCQGRTSTEPRSGSSSGCSSSGLPGSSSDNPIVIDSDDEDLPKQDRPPSYEESMRTDSRPESSRSETFVSSEQQSSAFNYSAFCTTTCPRCNFTFESSVSEARPSPRPTARGSGFVTPERSSTRRYISEIMSMRTRNNGGARVRFRVRWGPVGNEANESFEVVLQERQGLVRWLDRMRQHEPRRFQAVMRHHPEFNVVLEDRRGANYQQRGEQDSF